MVFTHKQFMIVYRIGRTKHSRDLSGEGARLHGGRWNHKNVACIYTSESRALALLEYSVNVNIEDVPRTLSITALKIPEKNIREITVEELPGNWRNSPAGGFVKNFGTKIIAEGKFLFLKFLPQLFRKNLIIC